MATAEDDARLGELFRLLRLERGLTQEELAIVTSIPVRDIHRLEIGLAGEVAYARLRRLFTEVGARARLSTWWNGATADRLLDQRHAALVEHGALLLAGYAWSTPTEVTFSEFGERGSIDILQRRAA